LDALPGLREIAKVINLSNIQRLSTPKDRLNVAMEVAKIILSNITEHKKKKNELSDEVGEGESVDDALGG
jgi:division protein CdvB (Snf7/Vps24/ESCRT-III family)